MFIASAASSEKKSLSVTDLEPIDIDQLVSETDSHSSDSCAQLVELPTVKMNNLSCDLRPSPFKPSYLVSMGVGIKEMPTNEVIFPCILFMLFIFGSDCLKVVAILVLSKNYFICFCLTYFNV